MRKIVLVRIWTMELSRHMSQFAPLPVFSGRFRFAPFGAFYYWCIVNHTPILYGADVSRFANLIFNRTPRQASWNSSTSWAASFATRPPEPHDCRVSYPIAEFSFLLLTPRVLPSEPRQFSVCGCRTFTACVVRHLLFSNSRIIAVCHFIHDRVFVFAALSAPCSGGFRVFLRLHSLLICLLVLVNLGVNRPFVGPLFFICLLHLDLADSMSVFLLVQVFSFRRSGGSGTRWLVQGFLRRPSSHCSVKSLPYLLHCCRKFFFLRRSSGSSDCQIEFVNIFTSHFNFWKNLLPVPFRHGFDPISFQFQSDINLFYLQLFHFIVTLDVHSLISINRSAPFQHLNFTVSHRLSNSSIWRASGAGPEQSSILNSFPQWVFFVYDNDFS